jgi:hypothetical protein
MTDDLQGRFSDADQPAPDVQDEATSDEAPRVRLPIRGLEAFSALQRDLAAIDLSGFAAAEQNIAQIQFKIPELFATGDAIARHFANTIDFSQLAATHRALIGDGALSTAANTQSEWAKALAESVNFSALNEALASSATLAAFTVTGQALAETLRQQTSVFADIAQSLWVELPKIDLARFAEVIDSWIPSNLRAFPDLDKAAAMALHEGIPISWIPRSEIVVALVDASSREERQSILIDRQNDILDDCEEALTACGNEWATQCKNAIGALRAGFGAPAQSHAGNIIDSIVLALHGRNGREEAKSRLEAGFDDIPLLRPQRIDATLSPTSCHFLEDGHELAHNADDAFCFAWPWPRH